MHLGSLLCPLAHFLRLSARSSAKENVNLWCEALSSIFLFRGALRAKSKVSQVCVTFVINVCCHFGFSEQVEAVSEVISVGQISFKIVLSNLCVAVQMVQTNRKMQFYKVVEFQIFEHLGSLLPPAAHFLRLSARSSAKEKSAKHSPAFLHSRRPFGQNLEFFIFT